MNTPDKNLYSFNGPDYDGHAVYISEEHVGHNERSISWVADRGTDGTTIMTPIISQDWADTLKFSTGLSDFTLKAKRLYGGKEDVIDVNNRCSNLVLEVAEFHSQGKYVTTVKDSAGIDIRGEIITGGAEVDHDYGNWSDTGNQRVTGCVLGTYKADGSPVTVRCLNADRPMEVPGSGPYRYLFPHPDAWYHGIVVFFFLWTRRLKLWK